MDLPSSQGIFRSLAGGVNDMVATTDGIAKTQEALLATSRGLLEGEECESRVFCLSLGRAGGGGR